MLLQLTDLSEEPLHSQISRQLVDKILDGDLDDGAELESIRSLARAQHVSVNTVRRAYESLERDGLITSKPGKGFLVASLTPEQKQAIAAQRSLGSRSPLNVVESFSRQLISVFDPEILRGIMLKNLKKHLKIQTVDFAIFDDRTGEYSLMEAEHAPNKFSINKNDKLIEAVGKFTYPVKIDMLQFSANDSPLRQELQKRGVKMLIPLNEANQLLGFLAISGKNNGVGFSKEEINLMIVLANQFVTAMTTARFYVEAVEKRRFEEELKMAHQIQSDLLPKELPLDEKLEITGYSKPSQTVGGDFYDYIPIDDNRFALVIGDGCGKGLPAALLISQIQAMIRSEVNNGNDIQSILQSLNRQMVQHTPKDKFVTLFFGIFDCQTNEFEYATAGHNYPFWAKSKDEHYLLTCGGPALGLTAEASFEIGRIQLKPESAILFYTDGVTETMNSQQEEYGEARLLKQFQSNHNLSTTQILENILDDLNKFSQNDSLFDDRTILLLKVKQ